MSKEFARCPHPECDTTIPVPKVYLAGGRSVVVHRVSRPLRRGDKVVVRHTYYGVHGATSGEWYSVETLSRGGKNPRDSYGTPIDLERIVGVVFDEKEAVSQ